MQSIKYLSAAASLFGAANA